MKLRDFFDKINDISSIFISLYNLKEKKPTKMIRYQDKDTMLEEIGDFIMVEYSYGSYDKFPVIIIGYEVED